MSEFKNRINLFKNWPVFIIGWLCFSLSLPFLLSAGITGKISGTVKDKTTNEPLPGVNIQIVNTHIGAASNIQGKYFILSIPPGNYVLKVSMMGYSSQEIKNLRVSSDQTTKINIQMLQETLDLGQTVEIVAKRPVIQKDLTTSIEVVNMEKMKQSTATEVNEAVNLQTGVFFDPIPVDPIISNNGRGEARYSIRGGDQDEVVWFIDGTRSAAMSEARADAGGSYTTINTDAVREIEVITGGFNAEYGQAQSGIVNVITKDGSEKYTFSADYQYGPAHQRHFGDYIYDREKNVEFLLHTLYDSLNHANYLDPAWWTHDRAKQVYDYRKFPDYDLRFSFGGPMPGTFMPLIGDELAKMTFFLTGHYQQKAYPLPRPRDTRKLTNINLSGKYKIKPGMLMKFGGMYSHDAHATNNEESFPLWYSKYYRGYGSLLDNYVYQLRLGLTHTIKPAMFYEIKLSSYTLKQQEKPSPYRVLGESQKPDIWGWHLYDGFEDEPFIAHLFSPKAENRTSDLSLVSHLNWQINNNNLIKAGIEFHHNTYAEDSWVLPSFSDSLQYWRTRGLNETYHPLQMGIFIQDKMEFESMILNIGIRYDFFDGNRNWFTRESFALNPALDPDFNPGLDPDNDGIDSLGHKLWSFDNILAKPRERVKPFHSINPRLGISFPITDQSVFHFSYGHFYQMPAINSQYVLTYFRPVAKIKGAPSNVRDTDPERVIIMTLEPLKPEKTIQFELGIKHHFENLAVVNLTGFYKDVFDQVEQPGFLDKGILSSNPFPKYPKAEHYASYTSRLSGDYGDARGLEFSLRTLFSDRFVFDCNYSFSKTSFGKGTPSRVYLEADGTVNYQWYVEASDRLPVERSYSRPHILRANIFMQYPDSWKYPVLYQIFGNSDLSLLYRYVSGRTYTYLEPDDPPDLLDNHRFPAMQTWDLKFNKYLRLGTHTLTLYTKVTNLFNRKNIRNWGNPWDYEALEKFVETGEPSLTEPRGEDKNGNPLLYNIGYSIYYQPRSIWFGVKYNFR